ncbi:oxygenase MpaB family protein [Microbacterium sp. KSW4-11]|uniref:Oxygenase MpaB family protein n=1 Tax=Microbacterium gawkjiense TaxID=3067309 RepID=A0ABU3GDS4_9MICO|nr:oxygenase MpaB family protein [Microbacterium sp. KSW4-11]MDT3317690.1 oxygenase MpaB family protein [Microbacterium sp. KSW4-11]
MGRARRHHGALLLRALHSGALAAVHDWACYREDPIRRLTGTVRSVITLTYASTTEADAETARVGRFHRRVRGTGVLRWPSLVKRGIG